MLTPLEKRSVESAIAECDRYIAKEEKRSADLRPPEIVKLLDWYKQHRAKLVLMLEAK